MTACRLRSTGIGSGSTVDTCSYVSPVHASRGHYFYEPLHLAVLRCCLPEVPVWFFFWRRLLDFFPCSALLGSTVNTCFFQFTEAYVLGSCDRFSSCSLLPYTAQYLVLSGTCYSSVYGVVEFQVFLRAKVDYGFCGRFSGHVFRPLVSDSHLFVASPEEYMIWIFWEMTSGIISVFSTLWFDSGCMYGVRLRGFWKNFTRFST